jgi:hypothetical protein
VDECKKDAVKRKSFQFSGRGAVNTTLMMNKTGDLDETSSIKHIDSHEIIDTIV